MKAIAIKYYPWIPLLLLCLFFLYRAINFPVHDFGNYYFGGKFMADGNFNSNIYFPYWFNTEILALGYAPEFNGFAPNSPFLALLFIPFSFLNIAAAKIVFNCISLALFIWSIYRLADHYRINWKYLLLIPILFLVPIKNNLLFGQVYFLLFFFLTEFWLAYEKKQFIKTAFFLSLAILLKVFPILLIVVFLFRKQFKPLLYTFGFCVLFLLMTSIFCGFDIWLFYIKNVLIKASNGEVASAYVTNYQSAFMFLKQLLVYDTTENPTAFFNFPVLFTAMIFSLKIGVLAFGYFVTKRISNLLIVFSYWILAMILISPYGSTYTFILLIFPFLALAKSDVSTIKKATLFVLLFLINNLLLRFFIENEFPFSYLRLFAFVLFFMGFAILFFRKTGFKKVALISICFFVLCFFFNKGTNVNSVYALEKDAPLLIYDYTIANNQLTYFYWNEKGENSRSIPFSAKTSKEIELRNNQLFYNQKQLTFDNSNKLKPMLIDNSTIIYLSDYYRGIGFYTLRKITLH